MKRFAGLLALALAVGVVVAGCGGGSKSGGGGERLSKADYLAKVKAIGDTMNSSLSGLGDTSSDPKKAADQFSKLQDALKGASAELAALNPPAEIASAHKAFTEGVSMLADEIGKASAGLASGDVNAALAFVASLASSDAMKKIQQAADELGKAGYDVSGSG